MLFALAFVLILVCSSDRIFDVIWNAPSSGCKNLTIGDYNVRTNPGLNFTGPVITLMYKFGRFPVLNATKNQTACWEKDVKGCSYNPWDKIEEIDNGGVPQLSNITLHQQSLKADIESKIWDRNFTGFLIMDWEDWNPLYMMNYDERSKYKEYSRRLVAEERAWKNSSEKDIDEEAKRRFNEGSRLFFEATISTIRNIRPNALIGFYGFTSGRSVQEGELWNSELLWLWKIVDVLCPSIYPRHTNQTKNAEYASSEVLGAMDCRNMVTSFPRPLVMPYARAPWDGNYSSFDVATQVQIPAGLGAAGVILWGSSADYHDHGCEKIETAISDVMGPTTRDCILNRISCSSKYCTGKGRCVDYISDTFKSNCLMDFGPAKTRCVPFSTYLQN